MIPFGNLPKLKLKTTGATTAIFNHYKIIKVKILYTIWKSLLNAILKLFSIDQQCCPIVLRKYSMAKSLKE